MLDSHSIAELACKLHEASRLLFRKLKSRKSPALKAIGGRDIQFRCHSSVVAESPSCGVLTKDNSAVAEFWRKRQLIGKQITIAGPIASLSAKGPRFGEVSYHRYNISSVEAAYAETSRSGRRSDSRRR